MVLTPSEVFMPTSVAPSPSGGTDWLMKRKDYAAFRGISLRTLSRLEAAGHVPRRIPLTGRTYGYWASEALAHARDHL